VKVVYILTNNMYRKHSLETVLILVKLKVIIIGKQRHLGHGDLRDKVHMVSVI